LLPCAADLNQILVGLKVVVEDTDRFPGVLVVTETRADGVGLVGAHLTVTEPVLNGPIRVPSVITRERLFRWRIRILEDLVFAIEDGTSFDGGLVRVNVFLFFTTKLLLVFDVLMGLVDINVSSRQSLNSNERIRIKYQVAIDDYNFKNETNWRLDPVLTTFSIL